MFHFASCIRDSVIMHRIWNTLSVRLVKIELSYIVQIKLEAKMRKILTRFVYQIKDIFVSAPFSALKSLGPHPFELVSGFVYIRKHFVAVTHFVHTYPA